jgi:integrase
VDEATGKAATAHDYRRAFGTRWSKRVMPCVLKRLMRHKDINTTLKYYIDSEAEDIATDLWAAYEKAQGNNSGNSPQERGQIAREIVNR